jgi:hypothetical protein
MHGVPQEPRDRRVKDLGLSLRRSKNQHGSEVYIILFHHWQNTLNASIQSLLLPFLANVVPFLQTVNHVVFDCPRHDAALRAQLTLILTSTTRQADRSSDYLGCHRMEIGRIRCCAF